MKPRIICKCLAVAVILLFIGLGVQPAIAITPNTSDSEDDCNLCPKKISKLPLSLIEKLLDRREKYNNHLSVLSKYCPELEDKYQDFYYRILEQNQLLRNYKQDKSNGRESICNLLGFHIWNLAVRDVFFTNLADDLIYTNPILGIISYILAYMYYFRILIIGAFGSIIGCLEYWFENY